MPKPRQGESRKSYLKRCIPMVLKEGTAKDRDQAVAVCSSMFRRKAKATVANKLRGKHFWLQGKLAKAKAVGVDKFLLMANTGKPMDLEGFYEPVIVDLKGARFDKDKTPVLVDHSTAKRMGHTLDQVIVPFGAKAEINGVEVKGPMVAAVGIRSSKMRVAKGIVEDMRGEFPFQVSIGAKIVKAKFVDEGKQVEVNGKLWKGPLIVASISLIREISITVLGADSETSASIAAKTLSRRDSMNFRAYLRKLKLRAERLDKETLATLKAGWRAKYSQKPPVAKAKSGKKRLVKATAGGDPDDGDDDDDDAEPETDDDDPSALSNSRIAANELRLDGIRAVAEEFGNLKTVKLTIKGKETEFTIPQLKAKAIKEKWSVETFELHCRRAGYPEPTGEGPPIHMVDKDVKAEAVEAYILRAHANVPEEETNPISKRKYGLRQFFKAEVLEASHNPVNMINGLDDLFHLQVRAAGKHPRARGGQGLFIEAHDAVQYIKASGFSTLQITNILENVIHKTAVASFEGVEALWRFLTGERPLSDFKPHALYTLDFDGSVKKVATDGELKHISMKDSKKTIQAETYGAMITIDRKTQVDDDLGLVLAKAQSIGTLVGQRIEESVAVMLLSNPGSFFSAGNNNLITGAGTALSATSLGQARDLYRLHVVNGKPVSVSPRILLVPSTLEDTANRLWGEERFAATGSTDALVFTNNPHKGLYRPYVWPYLNNTAIRDENGTALSGQSNTAWYLLGDPKSPQGAALVIGFLNGRKTPFVDRAETQFNIPGGIQIRTYLDWGLAMHITQLAVKSAGA